MPAIGRGRRSRPDESENWVRKPTAPAPIGAWMSGVRKILPSLRYFLPKSRKSPARQKPSQKILRWAFLIYYFLDICDFRFTPDFVRMRLYRERASEFELSAETEDSPDVRLRYRIVARHYRELAEREDKADKARMAERLERLRVQRQKPAATQTTLSAESDAPQFLLAAAE
jgi:hypothetical protein